MPAPIRIAIVEDIFDIADVLREAINDEIDMECAQVYGNAEDALTFLPQNPPDIAVMDIGLASEERHRSCSPTLGQIAEHPVLHVHHL